MLFIMIRNLKSYRFATVFLLTLFSPSLAFAFGNPAIVLNHPDHPIFHANAMDQPRLYGVLTDGVQVIEDEDGPVVFRAFIDTGSSGFVLSNLHATGDHDQRSFGFLEDDYVGEYTNLGLGGLEAGNVSRPFGVRMINDPAPPTGQAPVSDFIDYGEHRLWVRQAPGIGEVNEFTVGDRVTLLHSPVNIVGMPVIQQRTMVMRWKSLDLDGLLPPEAKELETKLLPPDDSAIPSTDYTLELAMRDFVGEPEEGETQPSVSKNPLVRDVQITHDPSRETVTADWLFDTGAGSSFISFTWAQQIGLIDDAYDDLETFVVDHRENDGIISEVGGIGPDTVTIPVLDLNEIRIPTREGIDLVWENVRVMIFDHPELAELGLEWIFGMNLIGPSVTIDASLLDGVSLGGNMQGADELLAFFEDISPSPFSSIVFEVTGDETAELRLVSDFPPHGNPTSFGDWRGRHFAPEDQDEVSMAGYQADPDGDGVPNLLEYALARDPATPSRARLPAASFTEIDGQRHLTLTYERIKPGHDLDFIVEASDDMATWTDATGSAIKTVIDLHDRERVIVRDPQPWPISPRRFLRLRVDLLE